MTTPDPMQAALDEAERIRQAALADADAIRQAAREQAARIMQEPAAALRKALATLDK
jgi:cell division septum initiation protein DivIVA